MPLDQDRIRLTKAMGWKHEPDYQGVGAWIDYGSGKRQGRVKFDVPDPFTDANDDYAVLEWMRSQKENRNFFEECNESAWSYEIGDYARAAMEVLGEINGTY